MSKSILLADDSAVARRAIRNLVSETLGDAVAFDEVASGVEALDKAIVSQPDVVILDLVMPGMKGFQAAREIGRHCPNTAVLSISNHNVEPILPRIRDAGIRGFVPKSSMASELIPAIEALLDGKTYFVDRTAMWHVTR